MSLSLLDFFDLRLVSNVRKALWYMAAAQIRSARQLMSVIGRTTVPRALVMTVREPQSQGTIGHL